MEAGHGGERQVSSTAGWSRRKKWIFGTFLALFCIAASFLGAEVLYRAYRRVYAPRKLAFVRVNPHGTGSYRLLPGLRVVTHVEGRRVVFRTNSHGMPWREVPVEKRAGVRRVAFVGDSFTFGLWASSPGLNFVSVFDSAESPHGVEAFNFGTPGYGLDDMELQIREDVLPFRPDDVVLVFYDGNDFSDTWLGTGKFRVSNGRLLNAGIMKTKVPRRWRMDIGAPALHPSTEERIGGFLKAHFSFLRFLSNRPGVQVSREFQVKERFLARSFWSQVPYPPIAEEAKDVSLRTLGEIDDLCRRNHVRLLIVALPYREQVYSARERGANYDIHRPQRFVEAFARERGIPYLDLLSAARRDVERTHAVLYARRDPHLNDRGHATFGRAIAEWYEGLQGEEGAGGGPAAPPTGDTSTQRPARSAPGT